MKALLSLLCLASVFIFQSQSRAEDLPPKEKLKIYLLMGQSNMAGVAPITEEDKTPHPRVLAFNQKKEWQLAVEPLHSKNGKQSIGPGFAFGREMAEKNESIFIGLVPCAVGGTPLSRWSRGGDLYSNAVARAKAAAKSGELVGVIWHQGEADSKTNTTADTYGERLQKMISDFRADVNAPQLPFVVGQIGQFLYERKDGRYPFARKINDTLTQIPEKVPFTACAHSDELEHIGDELHFNNKSQHEMGRRYAEQMIKLQESGK